MNDGARSKAELLAEVGQLRQRVDELENSTRMMRRAMETLRETDGSYRLVVEEFPQGIVIVKDGPARIIYANESAARILGQSVDDLMRLPLDTWLDFVHEEDRERVAKCFAGGIPRMREPVAAGFRLVRPDGRERLIELAANRLHTKGRDTVQATFADVTDGLRPEAAAGVPKHQEVVFEFAPYACFFQDLDGAFLDANPVAEQLIGYRREDLVGKGFRDLGLLSRADLKRADKLLSRIAGGEPTEPEEFVLRRRDGSGVAVEISLQPVEVDGAALVLGIAVDVSATRKVREAAAVQQEQLQLMLDNVFGGISICEYDDQTRKKRLIYCNDRFVDLSGQSRAQLEEADDLNELLRKGLAFEELEAYHTHVLKGEPYEGTLAWKRRGGAESVHDFSAVSVRSGGRLLVVELFRDVTAQARSRRALEESEERLRTLVDTSFDGISICELDPATGMRRLLFCNDRYVQMSGRDRDELMQAEDIRGFADPLLPDEETKELDRRMLAGELVRGAASWRRSDGKANVYEYAAVAVPVGDKYRIYGFDRDVTEGRQAEEALRASEERFRMVASSVQDGINICEWNPETRKRRLVWCNDRFVEMSGYSREDLMAAQSIEDLISADGTSQEDEEVVRCIEEGRPLRGVASWNRPDGLDNQYEYAAVAAPHGDVYRIYGVDRDITERKGAEEALRESEERFRLLVDTAFDGINICERDTETGARRLVFCNDRFVEMSGYSHEELMACENLDDLCVPHWSPEEEQEQLARAEQGLPYFGLASWKRPDGAENYHEWSAVRIRMGDQDRIFGVDRDITDRTKAEQALRRSEERFRSLVETAFDGISITVFDPVADIRTLVFCNSRFVEMSGYSREELEACPDLSDLVDLHLSPEQAEENRRRMAAGEPFRSTMSWRRPDGVENYVESAAVALDVSDVYHLVSVDRDITSRVKAEDERRALEDQMRQAQKLESLGVLAGGIAHDFNNLLTGVLGNAGLALSELPPESPARYSVEQIHLSAQHAAELCRQMLAYSGRGQFVIQPLDLSRLVREMGHLIDVAVSRRAVIEYRLADDLPSVEGDATQLRQVIMNLLTNAAEAIGDRSGLIVVRSGVKHVDADYLAGACLGEYLEERDYVFIEVADTGVGMDEETRGRIFEPFFTTKFAGRGLGLAAVLGIVRGHGGAIAVRSAPGEGSTFELILPSSPQSAAAAREDGTGPEGRWEADGTVLVVDDEEVVRTVSQRTLERAGLEVLTAADGQEGVDLFQTRSADIGLVLLDLTMPRMSGDDAFRAMRTIRPDVKGILLSGYTQEDAGTRFSGEGMVGFIQKPYDPATLLARVREALKV